MVGVTWYVLHQGEEPPFHSECLLHHGSAHDASHVLIVYAGIMALMLPIKWSLFFAGDIIGLTLFFAGEVIGLALPTNLLMMDGIKPGREGTVLFWCFHLEDFFPFFFPGISPLIVGFSSFTSFALFPSGLSLCFCFFSPLNQIYDSVKCGGVLQIWHRLTLNTLGSPLLSPLLASVDTWTIHKNNNN